MVESLNGRLRDECLNGHWFQTLDKAREKIGRWRVNHNNDRPYSRSSAASPPVRGYVPWVRVDFGVRATLYLRTSNMAPPTRPSGNAPGSGTAAVVLSAPQLVSEEYEGS